MPRFYLHLQRSDECIPDEEGQDFQSLEHALSAARAALCEIAGDHLRASQPIILEAIDIADEEGNALGMVTTTEALRPLLPSDLSLLIKSAELKEQFDPA